MSNGVFLGLALAQINKCEYNCAVLVPPSHTPRVRVLPLMEDPGTGMINIVMEGSCHHNEGGDI